MQLFEDRISSGRPLERLVVNVVGFDKLIDELHKFFDADAEPRQINFSVTKEKNRPH